MKHTPGPWEFDGKDTIKRPGGHTSDQADICYMNEEGGNESSEWFADPDVVRADACLIVSAPDLLEALNKILSIDESKGGIMQRIAKIAIAKAYHQSKEKL